MPLHDFLCSTCGREQRDVYRSIDVGALGSVPICASCGTPLTWIPKVGAVDTYEPMVEFETTDGRGQRVVIDSLHKLRQIERESEQQARNGEGQQMVWRQYSQDPSQRHDHTLMKDPTPAISGKTKRGEPIVREVLQADESGEPHVEMGAGVVGVSPFDVGSS